MVPKGKRSESSVEFFYKAYKLSDSITMFLIRDFGLKPMVKDLKTFTYNAKMSKEDSQEFKLLCEKYNIGVEADYPLWLIEHYRNVAISLVSDIINDITQANTIYPNSEYEFNIRRQYQWKAIGCCYQLLQLFQSVIRIFHYKGQKFTDRFMPYVDMIDEEIQLLKKWKKSDNRILKAIREKEAKERMKNLNSNTVYNQNQYDDLVNYKKESKFNNLGDTINSVSYKSTNLDFPTTIVTNKPETKQEIVKPITISPITFCK